MTIETTSTTSSFEPHDFSLIERDRRLSLLRAQMDLAGIGILVLPTAIDARYLSNQRHGVECVILPLAEEPTALVESSFRSSTTQPWVSDVRVADHGRTAAIVDRLTELDADRKIVGIVGLDGGGSLPEGDLNYTTFIALRECFSHTRWVGATSLLQEARMVKSSEEIATLAQAANAADAALVAEIAAVHTGVRGRDLWIAMATAAVRAGADPPPTIGLGHTKERSTDDQAGIREGSILNSHVAAEVNGYSARSGQTIGLKPSPEGWETTRDRLQEIWATAWERLRVGTPIEAVSQLANNASDEKMHFQIQLNGIGLGDDLPAFPPPPTYRPREEPFILVEGLCFLLAVEVTSRVSESEFHISWGQSVFLGGAGAQPLGSRPPSAIVCT